MEFSEVTEVPGDPTTHQAISMLYTRYSWAGSFCQGKDVLEVGCGTGVGLAHLAESAATVTAGDYTDSLLRLGWRHYVGRFPLVRLDGCALPFRDDSFDVVILFEAIYYLADADRFFNECRRILRDGGAVLICSANKERPGFSPSASSVKYFSASELRTILAEHGFEASTYAAFPVAPSLNRHTRGTARWIARNLRLNEAVKNFVRRVWFGSAPTFPNQVGDEMVELAELITVDGASSVPDYQVIYATGRLP